MFERDHGDGSNTSLRDQIAARLNDAGLGRADGRVEMLVMPRILGRAFNPLTVYFCRDVQGALAAILFGVIIGTYSSIFVAAPMLIILPRAFLSDASALTLGESLAVLASIAYFTFLQGRDQGATIGLHHRRFERSLNGARRAEVKASRQRNHEHLFVSFSTKVHGTWLLFLVEFRKS